MICTDVTSKQTKWQDTQQWMFMLIKQNNLHTLTKKHQRVITDTQESSGGGIQEVSKMRQRFKLYCKSIQFKSDQD